MPDNFFFSPLTISDLRNIIEQAVKDGLKSLNLEKDELLSSEEVQDLLKISHTTLQKWRDHKQIPFTRKGNKIFYRKKEIIELFKTKDSSTK